MTTKKSKAIYWTATGLFSALMLMNAGMYVFNNLMVSEVITALGYPTHIIYPLALLKVLGVVAILTRKSKVLKEWAYAGFTFTLLLASHAHFMANDEAVTVVIPLMALTLLLTSYTYDKKVF